MAKPIDARIAAAEAAVRKQRAKLARLKRAAKKSARHVDNERKYMLGAAVMAWTQADPARMAAFMAFLGGYVQEDVRRECLIGTPWELPIQAEADDAPAWEESTSGAQVDPRNP